MDSRRPCLPLEQRIRLYNEVLQLQLREEGLSYNEIIGRIHRLHGVRLSTATISVWVNGRCQPLGRVNRFDGRPSPELATIIGAMLGDGTRQWRKDRHNYSLWLNVRDYEYAKEFGHCLSKVLGRKKPYKPWTSNGRIWRTAGNSILLYRFLDQPWQRLRLYIEHCRDCVAAFLKAFFDGEGSIRRRELRLYNSDRELLLYVQHLLQQYFSIETTGPHKETNAGERFHDSRTGKIYVTKKPCYCLYIRAYSLPLFHKYIGFTIKRKRRRLLKAIQS